MAQHIIELKNITKSYGNIYALGGVSLHVDPGEVVGLIGDNGAGKSTLIKILAGVIKPTSGEIFINGEPVNNWSPARSRASGIETVFQDRALAVQQSIVRNIFMRSSKTVTMRSKRLIWPGANGSTAAPAITRTAKPIRMGFHHGRNVVASRTARMTGAASSTPRDPDRNVIARPIAGPSSRT